MAHNKKIQDQFEKIRRANGNVDGSIESILLARNGKYIQESDSPSGNSDESDIDFQGRPKNPG